MAPNFVDNVIQVSMYKNLFARATNIQERRAREKEVSERSERAFWKRSIRATTKLN